MYIMRKEQNNFFTWSNYIKFLCREVIKGVWACSQEDEKTSNFFTSKSYQGCWKTFPRETASMVTPLLSNDLKSNYGTGDVLAKLEIMKQGKCVKK